VGEFPYVFLDGLWLKRSWGGEVKNVSVLVAIGVAQTVSYPYVQLPTDESVVFTDFQSPYSC
jgi:hypothetical protein